MTQTVAASVQLGFAYAGASGIGYRVLRLDRSTVVVAFTTTGVVEAPVGSGQFQITGGHAAHDEGGYRVWGTSGADILWSDIEPAAPTVIQIQTGLATQTSVDTIDDFLDTEIAAIKAKTDNLPTDPADESNLTALLNAIDDFIDTEVAAIKAKTDLIPSDPADASDIATVITAAQTAITNAIAALNNLSQAQAQTAATAALNVYDPPTFAELDARTDVIDAAIAALDDLNSTQVEAAVNAALGAYDVATSTDVTTGNCGDGTFEFTYTLTSTVTGQPIPGATIRITTDIAGLNTAWTGTTDVLGVARNLCSDKPRLVSGTYYAWRSLSGYSFNDPDVEVIS